MSGNYYIAGVLAAIGAVLLVLAMAWVGTGPSPDTTMEWNDYEPLTSDIEGVGGSLEIVDVGGVQYIHAKELGNGVILKQGSKTTVKVTRATADLVLMDGQSNASYIYPDPSKAASPGPGVGYYFGYPNGMPDSTDDSLDACSIYDMVGPNGEPRVGNKAPGFAMGWDRITGHKTVWSFIGIPGASISQFQPDSGTVWDWNVRIVEAIQESLKDVPIDIDRTIMLWAQGETNYLYATPQAQYKEIWTAFHDAVDSGGLGVEVDSWHLVSGRTVAVGWVNEVFEDLSSELDDVSICVEPWLLDSFTMANGLMRNDDIHYTQEGCNAVGFEAARSIASHYGYSLGTAPIYLFENDIPCDLNESVTMPDTVKAYRTDGTWTYTDAVWESSPDTSQYGVEAIYGEVSTVAPSLEFAPVISLVKTGYVGWIGKLEYTKNSESTVAVINHDWTIGSITIPSEVDGMAVTEVQRQAFHHVPYTVMDVPDTVTTIGDYGIFGTPMIREVTMSENLTHVGGQGLTVTFVKNGEEITRPQIYADPSIIGGYWTWNGHTPGTVYYQEGP